MSRVKELCDRIENHYKPHEDNSDILTLTKIIRLQQKSLTFYSDKRFDRVCFMDHSTCNEEYGADARQTLEETNRIAHVNSEKDIVNFLQEQTTETGPIKFVRIEGKIK